MMREKARSSPRCAFRSTPRSGWVSDTAGSVTGIHQILSRHLYGFRYGEKREGGRRQVGKFAVVNVRGGIGEDEGHAVRRVRRVRSAVVRDQLLGIAVVGGDQADAAG